MMVYMMGMMVMDKVAGITLTNESEDTVTTPKYLSTDWNIIISICTNDIINDYHYICVI